MTDRLHIIKTMPRDCDIEDQIRRIHLAQIAGRLTYYKLGRGRPRQIKDDDMPGTRLYIVSHNFILGYWTIAQLFYIYDPIEIRRLDTGDFMGEGWYVRVDSKFVRLSPEPHYQGFQGWRYYTEDSKDEIRGELK